MHDLGYYGKRSKKVDMVPQVLARIGPYGSEETAAQYHPFNVSSA